MADPEAANGQVTRRRFLIGSAAVAFALTQGPLRRPERVLDPRDYGGVGDGQHDDTSAFQRAIDAAAKQGGRARVPKGMWRSGTLRLRSNLTIELVAGAVLLASPDDGDFLPREDLPYPTYSDFETSDFQNSLLFGDELERVAIVRRGAIDANRAVPPLFVRLGNRGRGQQPPTPGTVRDVTFRNITATVAGTLPSSVTGIPDHPVERITLDRVRITTAGRASTPAGSVPEAESAYPQVTMFGDLPAAVLYVRHAQAVVLRNAKLETASADQRPPLVTDDAAVRKSNS